MKHDGIIDIAVGESRHTKIWKNREILWSELVEKFSSPKINNISFEKYKSLPKAKQDEIKDVGGFVGGYLNNGSRRSGNLLHRQLISLDMDFGSMEIFEKLREVYNWAACVYSTHGHEKVNPRLRIIIPLSRPVFADEYQAISRKIADKLDIEVFDDTTYEPSRLMYWPATAKDGEFIFDYIDSPWIDPDIILDEYLNWEDSSAWPVSSRARESINNSIKHQENPLEKTGLIGAFCKAYTIEDAIAEFLPDVYIKGDTENRYTYKEGSTSNGLVIYDDIFAYSHHGTDPISGKLCNAFDLVRLHKFGLEDLEAKPRTPINRLPSFTKMREFVSKLDSIKKIINMEKIAEVKEDFKEDESYNYNWLEELDIDTKGRNRSTVANIELILLNDPELKDKFALNEFEHRPVIKGNLPWRKVDQRDPYHKDVDDSGLRGYLEEVYGITGQQKIFDGYNLVALKNAYNPVKEYLLSIDWDKTKRVDSLLIDYFGAEDNKYVRLATRKAITACVARIFEPGIKFDYILTLVGKQGTGKSTFFRKLGKKWFSDTFTTVKGKEAYEQIQGIWIVEIGELAAFKDWEVEHVKHFISKQEDFFRVAYGRRNESFPRQCVFFGTTNRSDFLKDPTGNRRFWPVDIRVEEPKKSIFKELTEDEVDQIWAEAVLYYMDGEKLFLTKEVEDLAVEVQKSHSEMDERLGLVLEFLEKDIPINWYDLSIGEMKSYTSEEGFTKDPIYSETKIPRDKVCAAEIWTVAFGLDIAELDNRNRREIDDLILSIDSWEEYDRSKCRGRLRFGPFGTLKAYVPTE